MKKLCLSVALLCLVAIACFSQTTNPPSTIGGGVSSNTTNAPGIVTNHPTYNPSGTNVPDSVPYNYGAAFYYGTNTPFALIAPPGSIYNQLSVGNSNFVAQYVKTTSSGSNGWVLTTNTVNAATFDGDPPSSFARASNQIPTTPIGNKQQVLSSNIFMFQAGVGAGIGNLGCDFIIQSNGCVTLGNTTIQYVPTNFFFVSSSSAKWNHWFTNSGANPNVWAAYNQNPPALVTNEGIFYSCFVSGHDSLATNATLFGSYTQGIFQTGASNPTNALVIPYPVIMGVLTIGQSTNQFPPACVVYAAGGMASQNTAFTNWFFTSADGITITTNHTP